MIKFNSIYFFFFMTLTTLVGCSNPLGSGDSEIDENYNPGAPGVATATGVAMSFDEDTESPYITLAYEGEAGAMAQSCTISDLNNVVVTQTCICSTGVCTVKVQGTTNFYGAASFRYRVTDQEGRLSNSALADLTIKPVNDAPTLAYIGSQSALAGQATLVNLSAQDVDSVLNCALPSTLWATSDQAGVIPTTNIVFGGSAPSCTATITPIANQRGTVNLQFTLSDGSLTATQSFSISVTSPPTEPTSLTATSGVGQVGLNWADSAGGFAPITYTVYRSTTSGSGYTALATCTNIIATSCNDTTVSNGVTYFYIVRASNIDGNSGDSNEVSALTVDLPSASNLSRTITQASRVDLSWSTSIGTGSITYTVGRSTTSGSGYVNVADCVGLSTTTCNDSAVVAGTTYYYIVTATNVGGSTISNEVSVVPIAPFTVLLTPGNRQIQASFMSFGATSYSLQYGTSSGSYSMTISDAVSPATVSSLVNGTTYYFIVTASNDAGSVIATSEVSGTPNGPHPFSISSATVGNTQVALMWEPSIGATSYNVRYGMSTESYPTTFATGLVGTTNTLTGLTNGTTYYIMVTAVNANGTQDAVAEFVRTPAQPTLSSISNQLIETQPAGWSIDIPFTLGGLSTFSCDGTVVANSSNTSFVAEDSLLLSGAYPDCNLNIAVLAGQTGSTTITLTATYGSASATSAFQFRAFECPANYVAVSALSPYTTTPFCVAKYEMKNIGGVATSQAADMPWTSIPREILPTTEGGAWKACLDLGIGYDLISNAQWQTIARDLEGVSWNWSGGTVGNSGGLNRGHSDNSPENALAASTDDNDSCFGTGQICDLSTWSNQRRVHRLSNGSYVWDFAGNVLEWVRDDNSTNFGANGNISTITPLNRPNTGIIGGVLNNANYHFGPAGDYTGLSSSPFGGLGFGYLNFSAGAIVRGGRWDYMGNSGIFTTYLAWGPKIVSSGSGFRCVWSP